MLGNFVCLIHPAERDLMILASSGCFQSRKQVSSVIPFISLKPTRDNQSPEFLFAEFIKFLLNVFLEFDCH